MKALAIVLLLSTWPVPARAQEQSAAWIEQKCNAYQAAWLQAAEVHDETQINYAFIAANGNFIAGGCTGGVDVCPRSAVELDIANILTLALMNAGAASTFLPFRCPAEPSSDAWSGPGL